MSSNLFNNVSSSVVQNSVDILNAVLELKFNGLFKAIVCDFGYDSYEFPGCRNECYGSSIVVELPDSFVSNKIGVEINGEPEFFIDDIDSTDIFVRIDEIVGYLASANLTLVRYD